MSIFKDLGVPGFKAGGMPAIDLSNYFLFVGGWSNKKAYSSSFPDHLMTPL